MKENKDALKALYGKRNELRAKLHRKDVEIEEIEEAQSQIDED